MIDLKNFVNININYFASSTVSGSRESCVLISSTSFNKKVESETTTILYKGSTDTYFLSESDFVEQAKGQETPFVQESDIRNSKLFKYVKCFFVNGGKKLHFIEINDENITVPSNSTLNEEIKSLIKSVIDELPNEESVITSTFSRKIMQPIAKDIQSLEKFKGINEKMFVTNLLSFDKSKAACIPVLPSKQPEKNAANIASGKYFTKSSSAEELTGGYLIDSNGYSYSPMTSESTGLFYIMKYVGNDNWFNAQDGQDAELPEENEISNLIMKLGVSGCEMSLAAYLTKINVYNGSINDYCYTKENLDMFDNEVVQSTVESVTSSILVESVIVNDNVKVSVDGEDMSIIEAIKMKNVNCDVDLPSYGTVSIGGNMTNGRDLVNNFVKIVMSQTLSSRLMNVLANKIRYTQSGLGIISNTLCNELNKYRDFGYLSTDKIYTGEDVYDPSGKFLLLRKNSPLAMGYTFTILPFNSLSDEDKRNHKLPKIYLIIADSYSVREIDIEGYVY